jgi:hypothetical protein
MDEHWETSSDAMAPEVAQIAAECSETLATAARLRPARKLTGFNPALSVGSQS